MVNRRGILIQYCRTSWFNLQEETSMGQQIRVWVICIAVAAGVLCADAAFAQDKTQPLPWDAPAAAWQGLEDCLPVPPRLPEPQSKLTLPRILAEVPEVRFEQPLAKSMNSDDVGRHIRRTIEKVNLLNEMKTDAFIEALLSKRPDLAGLPFALGDACRLKDEAGRQFAAAVEDARRAQDAREFKVGGGESVIEDQMKYYREPAGNEIDPSARVAALMQKFGAESAKTRLSLVKYLDGAAHADATRALARLAIFSEEAEIRSAAVRALKLRRDKDYTDILLAGLKYPWPAVAERSSEAIVKLGRSDLVPQLSEILQGPDPRAPQVREVQGKKASVVREVVRIDHQRNCLLCHAPATSKRDKLSMEEKEKLARVTAEVPLPGAETVVYYRSSNPEMLVRFDVTYLRQDFSVKLFAADAAPAAQWQRYDFLVRTREVTDQEAVAFRELLQPSGAKTVSPYQSAALSALRELTGAGAELKEGVAQARER
jgi:hypothetical protein